jgi:TRAP-type mannitol/chloroaromatic compound transport system permease small subunit
MRALLKFSNAVDWLNAQVGKYAIWLILAATVISALNAIVRKVFNMSSNAFLESAVVPVRLVVPASRPATRCCSANT